MNRQQRRQVQANNHNMPSHMPGNLPDLSKLAAPANPMLERVKLCMIDISFIMQCLQMDGTVAIRMAGFPKECVAIGAEVVMLPREDGNLVPMLKLILHNPDWPAIVSGTAVPMVDVTWQSLPTNVFELEEKPSVEEDSDEPN